MLTNPWIVYGILALFTFLLVWILYRIIRSLLLLRRREKTLLNTAQDAVISANQEGNIISWNKGAEKMFGYSTKETVRKPLTLLMPKRFHGAHKAGIKRVTEGGPSHVIGKTVELAGRRKDGTEFPLELSLSRIEQGKKLYFLGIVRDITERNQLKEKQEQLITELQKALAQVKTLRGLVPICASCKKIRDDKGFWHEVETYVHEHSEADFTHGLCADCVEKLYHKEYKRLFPEGHPPEQKKPMEGEAK